MIRILTLNIHKGFTVFNTRFVLHELRDAIRATHADIVFLQEVQGVHDEKASRHDDWPDAAQYEFLADEVWQDYAYGKNAVYTEGHHGNAILSKYPIESWHRVDLSTNRIEQRGHLHCRLELPETGENLNCICIHLGLSAVSRRKQFAMIGEYMDSHIAAEEPLIVAGDTNDWTGAPSRRFAREKGLHEVQRVANGQPSRTFPARMPMLCLDRILVRGMTIQSSMAHTEPVWKTLSDHIPISADLEIEGGGEAHG